MTGRMCVLIIKSLPVPFEARKLVVPVKPMEWPADRLDRVGVNSFGLGGSNAHVRSPVSFWSSEPKLTYAKVILDSAASFGLPRDSKKSPGRKASENLPQLLPFSAKHPEALRRSVADHESYLSTYPDSLPDMSHTLALRREVLPYRAFTVARAGDSFDISRVHKSTHHSRSKLIYVFSGQGAQWAQMGSDLIYSEPTFRSSIERMDSDLARLPSPPAWTLLGLSAN